MYLTKQEERMLDGENGWANQVAMKILARLGDLYGATKLIPIQSAHLSGVSYKHLGAAIDFLSELANSGGSAQTLATLNPSSLDQQYLRKRYAKERIVQQERIVDVYGKMHIQPTLTCTPYYLERFDPGQHLAWAESSAVVYANSVLNAWTNREGAPSALAAALIGKTPDYGLHQAENRQPTAVVKLEAELKTESDYGALGIHLGKLLNDKVPVIHGLIGSVDELKQLGAAMASSGMTAFFQTDASIGCDKPEKVSVEASDIREAASNLCTTDQAPDLVFIGCPHCSEHEIRSVAQALEGKKVQKKLELWVCTSRHVRDKARRHVDVIERAGGKVLCDTCVLVSWIRDLGMHVLLTNSAKTAFYAPTLNQVETKFSPLKQCIDVACATAS